MRVQATKTMAMEINKHFKAIERFKGYKAVCHKGYDFWGCEKQVITIYYPYEYYAFPQDYCTEDLVKVFKQSDKTYEGFFEKLLEVVEV